MKQKVKIGECAIGKLLRGLCPRAMFPDAQVDFGPDGYHYGIFGLLDKIDQSNCEKTVVVRFLKDKPAEIAGKLI